MAWSTAAMLTYGVGAVIAGWRAHLTRKHPDMISLAWTLTAGLCVVFSVAWGWVVFDSDLDRGKWSELVTPASTIFPLIFTLPASIRIVRFYRDRVVVVIEKAGD